MVNLLIFIIFGIIGADAGGSAWWSNIWGEKGDGKGGRMPFNMTWFPEFLLALSVGIVSTICIGWPLSGFMNLSGAPLYGMLSVWLVATGVISMLGIQTGHAAILDHDEVDKIPKKRDNRLTPFVIRLCKILRIEWETKDGVSYTEAYVWVFWTVKGLIITLPLGGIGAIGLAVGYEIGSHFRGRPKYWRYNPHFASEFFAYALCVGGAILLWI